MNKFLIVGFGQYDLWGIEPLNCPPQHKAYLV